MAKPGSSTQRRTVAGKRSAESRTTGAEIRYRVRVEVPTEADKAVVRALRSVGEAFPGAEIEEVAVAPPNSYSLTVHAFPGKEQ